jgi:Chaperone of endosialidase
MKTNILSLILASLFTGFACLHQSKALTPPPDGGYPGGNTAEGQDALLSRITGVQNTAVGFLSLKTDTTGSYNTAIGSGTLLANNADGNTATGTFALLNNTIGFLNTANGVLALLSNTIGIGNTAVGYGALFSNTHSGGNTAIGSDALFNSTGSSNTAVGTYALQRNTTDDINTAIGAYALQELRTPGDSNNIALGYFAGGNVINGINDIFIGNIGNFSEDLDQNTIRIGTQVTATDFHGITHNRHVATYIAGISETGVSGAPVLVSADGQLGVALSAVRFKEAIKPIDTASEAIFALNPVTFRYKHDLDPAGVTQFGLVAEEVEKVNPDLVARDDHGKPYTVRYDAVNAMLLNEFLKEHRKVEKLKATVAQQHKDFEAAVTELKGQIEKVSAQLAAASPSRGGLEVGKFATGRIRRGGPALEVANNQ